MAAPGASSRPGLRCQQRLKRELLVALAFVSALQDINHWCFSALAVLRRQPGSTRRRSPPSWPSGTACPRPSRALRGRLLPRGASPTGAAVEPARADPHQWLEEVDSPEALAWVEAQNARTLEAFGDPSGSPLLPRLLRTETTDVDQDPLRKLPQVTKIGDFYYDFWSDALHPRGVWRRTTPSEYVSQEPAWEEVLGLDALGRSERESWVWRGYVLLDEGEGAQRDRVMVQLSRGGADAFVAREFDLGAKSFIPLEEGGFVVPEAKSLVCYRSRGTLLVSTDFGPGSLTSSGYPRSVRAWHRGTPLESAEVVFEGGPSDQVIYGYTVHERGGYVFEVIHRAVSFYDVERHVSMDGGRSFTPLKLPMDAELLTFRDNLLLKLGEDFIPPGGSKLFRSGSLLAAPAAAALAGMPGCWAPLWEPQEDVHAASAGATARFSALRHIAATRGHLVLSVLSRARSGIVAPRRQAGRPACRRTAPRPT